MTAVRDKPAAELASTPLHDRAAAEAYVASVCFKHGPPALVGVELEWTVHDARDPRQPLEVQRLAEALGPYAPTTVNPSSPNDPLPGASTVTVEPGGQVEISASPQTSLAALISTVSADSGILTDRLAAHGLALGAYGFDQHRIPRRLLDTPRYSAMEAAFAALGPDGLAWMCASAGLQVCLDAGEPHRVANRWALLHALGPVLSALFANSAQPDGAWASTRMRAMFRTDPVRTRPAAVTADPAASWARRVLDAPVLCVRRPGGRWEPPGRLSFAEWMAGALPDRPTVDDLDYHLSTLFPPVRPRGYLEVRYLDSQPMGEWIVPSALLAALLADESAVDAAMDAAAPAAGRWLHAARYGLADRRIAQAGRAVVELGSSLLASNTDLGEELTSAVVDRLGRRIAMHMGGAEA